jgi:hypothetical protein
MKLASFDALTIACTDYHLHIQCGKIDLSSDHHDLCLMTIFLEIGPYSDFRPVD